MGTEMEHGEASVSLVTCFYNVVLIKWTMFNLTAFFWLDRLFDFFFPMMLCTSRGFGNGTAIG